MSAENKALFQDFIDEMNNQDYILLTG